MNKKVIKGIIIGAVGVFVVLLGIGFLVDEGVISDDTGTTTKISADSNEDKNNNGISDKMECEQALAKVQSSQVDGYSLKQLYADFFSNPKWDTFIAKEDGNVVVEFTGTCKLLKTNQDGNVKLQWVINVKGFPQLHYMDINGVAQKDLDYYNEINQTALEEYIQGHVSG